MVPLGGSAWGQVEVGGQVLQGLMHSTAQGVGAKNTVPFLGFAPMTHSVP